MMVQSPLQLYSLLLGIKHYDAIWTILSKLGLVYLPFLVLMARGLVMLMEAPIDISADKSLRRTLMQGFTMMMVFFLGLKPMVPLDVKEISYQPICAVATKAVSKKTGTTYDDTFGDIQFGDLQVPLLLGLSLDVASGLTHAVTSKVPCTQNIDQLMHTISLTHFSHDLKTEVQQFDQECYWPAMQQMTHQHPEQDEKIKTKVTGDLKKYGKDDTGWMGSHLLQDLYYSDLRAHQEVAAFPYQEGGDYSLPSIDHNIKKGLQSKPAHGYPTCSSWWSDSTKGLEVRIVDAVDEQGVTNGHLNQTKPNVLSRMVAWVTHAHPDVSDAGASSNDIIARRALSATPQMQDAQRDFGGGLRAHITNVALELGALEKNVLTNPFNTGQAQEILPIVQALMLWAVLLIFPVVMIVANYQTKILSGLLFLLFGLQFSSAIWELLTMLHNFLSDSLSYFSFSNPQQKPILNSIFVFLYYGLPLFLSAAMGTTGVVMGGALSEIVGRSVSGFEPIHQTKAIDAGKVVDTVSKGVSSVGGSS